MQTTRKDYSVTKMSGKILKFKKDDKSKYERANRRCDDGDYVGALSSLLYTAESEPKNTEVLCHIADIYTELGLYENAVIFWFRFLSKCRKTDVIDGYNGLGANFFFLDNLELAGFYFNKQLGLGDYGECVYDDVLDEYVDAVANDDKPRFNVISAESERDEIDENNYRAAVEENKREDYISAVASAEKVSETSEFFEKALYEKAYGLFCLDREREACEILEKCVSIDKNDVNAYNLLLGCCAQAGDEEKVEIYFKKLLEVDSDNTEILNRKMSVLCDFGYPEEALAVSDKIMRLAPEDTNCSYLRGLLLYNLNQSEKSVLYLKKAYIYSLNPVALYYLRIAERACDGDTSVPKRLPLIFDLQKTETDRRLEAIKKLFGGTAEKDEYPEAYIKEIAEWCFIGGNQTAQMALAVYAARSKNKTMISFLRNQLINPALPDEIKIRIFSLLVETGELNDHSEVSVVYSNIFKKIKVFVPVFGPDAPVVFRQAYAYAAGRVSIYFDKEMKQLAVGVTELESAMRKSGGFSEFTDLRVIACAMFIYSGINRHADMDMIYKFFDAEKEGVARLIVYANKKQND